MKKRILLSMFSISLLVGTLPMNLVASGVEESIISTEYQEDGDIYYETVLEEASSNARSSTKSGSKTVKCKNKKGKILWTVKVHGSFTYNGKTAKCTSATVSNTCPAPNWKIVSSSAWKDGANAVAKATAKKYVSGQVTKTETKTVTLHCSASGKLS